MISFSQFLFEAKKRKGKYRDISTVYPTQSYPHQVDIGWVNYLRKHLRSKKSQAEFIRRNPNYIEQDWTIEPTPLPVAKVELWHPISVRDIATDNKTTRKVLDVLDGHHRYWARKLEGKKRIKTDI